MLRPLDDRCESLRRAAPACRTLFSERPRDRTRRLVGRLFVVTGLAMIVLALTGIMWLVLGVMLVMLALTLDSGHWDSYRQWRTDPDHRPTGNAA